MTNKQVHPLVLIGVAAVAIILVVYFGYHAMQPATPAAGSYTPGVPPWLDKAHHAATAGVHSAP